MDIVNQLRNNQSSVIASSSQDSAFMLSITEGQEVIDNELYLQEMATVDRNWEIPRNRLIISTEKLGGGEFGVVNKGVYMRTDGHELPVAVKRLKGLFYSVSGSTGQLLFLMNLFCWPYFKVSEKFRC